MFKQTNQLISAMKKISLIFGLSALGLLCQSAAIASDLLIEVPTDGTTFNPGDQLTVRVVPNPPSDFYRVGISLPEGVKLLEQVTEEGATAYELTTTIPDDYTGEFPIMVFGRTNDETFVRAPEVNVNVMPAASDVPIELLASMSRTLQYIDGVGTTSNILVQGRYNGNVLRNLSSAEMGTQYTSNNTAVAEVDVNGRVTAKSIGYSIITIEHKGLKTFHVANVYGEDIDLLPSEDVTNQTVITESGFRKDMETGFFVQQITIQNPGNLPILSPLHVVISDLPAGVELENDYGETRVVEPLGSPYTIVDPASIPPGETAKAILKFSNLHGRSITYQLRLFSGSKL